MRSAGFTNASLSTLPYGDREPGREAFGLAGGPAETSSSRIRRLLEGPYVGTGKFELIVGIIVSGPGSDV